MRHICIKIIFGVLLGWVSVQRTQAQGQPYVLFSGKVVEARTGEILPGAHIIIPKAGRGTTANAFGQFELPVWPGDSIVFSFVGFKKQFLKLPEHFTEPSYYAVVALKEDVRVLAEVKIYPYANEEDFKKAILELKLPDAQDRENLARNTSPERLQLASMTMGMGAAANSSLYLQNQATYQNNKGFLQTPEMALLNPFAWASLISSIKRGDLKDDRWKKAYSLPPLETVTRKNFIRQQNRTQN
jgi:CarboxypepD_reg-like domain